MIANPSLHDVTGVLRLNEFEISYSVKECCQRCPRGCEMGLKYENLNLFSFRDMTFFF